MHHRDTAIFEEFTGGLTGLPLSHLWNGVGSALFLEFGALRPRKRRDGSPADPTGEMTVMIEWSWRIEGKRSIICGSWSEEDKWERGFSVLRGQTVTSTTLFGRLPEIDIGFSNGAHCLSFMTAEGHPQWAVLARRGTRRRSIFFKNGQFRFDG
jgi:hypothetical protein